MNLRSVIRPDTIPAAAILLSALFFTLLIFFIDEGNYSLRGIFRLQNITGLAFYFAWILGSILLLKSVLGTRMNTSLLLIISISMGPLLGMAALYGIISLIVLL